MTRSSASCWRETSLCRAHKIQIPVRIEAGLCVIPQRKDFTGLAFRGQQDDLIPNHHFLCLSLWIVPRADVHFQLCNAAIGVEMKDMVTIGGVNHIGLITQMVF